MKGLARVTGIIFVVIGLLALLLGIYEMGRAFIRPEPFLPGLFGDPELSGALLPLRLLVGGLMTLQGLILAAFGEGLWLLSSLAEHGQKSSGYLAAMVPRGSLRIP